MHYGSWGALMCICFKLVIPAYNRVVDVSEINFKFFACPPGIMVPYEPQTSGETFKLLLQSRISCADFGSNIVVVLSFRFTLASHKMMKLERAWKELDTAAGVMNLRPSQMLTVKSHNSIWISQVLGTARRHGSALTIAPRTVPHLPRNTKVPVTIFL